MKDLIIRKGEIDDMNDVLLMIIELAKFENAAEQVNTTVEQLKIDGFGSKKLFEVIIAEYKNEICGYAFFYQGYSTWKGVTLYLEDLMVKAKNRKQGVGRCLFDEVIRIAKDRNVKRLDWQVLDWNSGAIEFYHQYKATLDGQWLNGRLFELDLKKF
jgi:GNAT superfamily N-acetyltransferase|tara:strand:- start:685 stop:1155 length:471 start_codon:yes stop_codon:yes gene_type:complete